MALVIFTTNVVNKLVRMETEEGMAISHIAFPTIYRYCAYKHERRVIMLMLPW